MSGGHEIDLAYQWLYNVLSADGTLTGYAPGGLFRSLAPPATATPFIIMAYQSGIDVITMNAFRLMDDLLFQVKVCGPANNTAALANAAQRIDQLIGSPPVSGTVTGGIVLSSNRNSPLLMDELVDGELWTNMGGLYRIQIQQH